jgi:hypothetical protein
VFIINGNGGGYLYYTSTGSTRECTVPIYDLQNNPFSLYNGDSVYAKVEAINAIGTSA